MKKRVEIITERSELEPIQLTKLELITKLQLDPVGTLISYDLGDDLILELIDYIPLSIFCDVYHPSESLIKKLLEIEYLTDEYLSQLSMTSISKLSPEFLESKIDFLNFDRIILNYCSGQEDYFIHNDPRKYIEMTQLHGPYFWRILSSNKLPKEVILENLEKWDWVLLSINNSFSDFTEEEFKLISPYLETINIDRITDSEILGEIEETNLEIGDLEQILNNYFKNKQDDTQN